MKNGQLLNFSPYTGTVPSLFSIVPEQVSSLYPVKTRRDSILLQSHAGEITEEITEIVCELTVTRVDVKSLRE